MPLTLKDALQNVGDFAQRVATPENFRSGLGAFASARSPQTLAGLQRSRLAEGQSQAKAAENQLGQITSGISEIDKIIQSTPKNSPDLQPILSMREGLAAKYQQLSGQPYQGIQDASVLAGSTLRAQAAREGVTEDVTKRKEDRALERQLEEEGRELLTTVGEENRAERAKRREEIRKEEITKRAEARKVKVPKIQNYAWTDAEGKKQQASIDLNDPTEVARMKKLGAIAVGKPQRITQGTPEQMLEGPIDRTHARGLRKGLDKDKAAIAELTVAMDALEKTPGAAGVSGAIVDNKFMNMLAQLPGGKGVREGISQTIAGTSASEIVAIRTRARTIVASQLSAITGEEGNRFTEQEREIAENTLRGLKASNDVETIRSAYRVVMELNISSRDKNREGLGIGPKHDVTTKDGRASFYVELRERGFGEDEAITYIKGRAKEARLNE